MLEGKGQMSAQLQKIIDDRTEPWGVNVISVEVKDVISLLRCRMPCRCRHRLNGTSGKGSLVIPNGRLAEKFGEAAKTYENNPVALHLRAMNMLYEGLKTNSTIVIVPSSALETMQLGGLAGMNSSYNGIDSRR